MHFYTRGTQWSSQTQIIHVSWYDRNSFHSIKLCCLIRMHSTQPPIKSHPCEHRSSTQCSFNIETALGECQCLLECAFKWWTTYWWAKTSSIVSQRIQSTSWLSWLAMSTYNHLIVHGHSHQGVHFGINARSINSLFHTLWYFFGRGQDPSFIKGLICINLKWPPYDLPIITLCPITSEQIKIDKWIRHQNNQNSTCNFVRLRI